MVTVHTHTADESGLLVNSFILETPDELVVVDTGLLNPDIDAFRDRVTGLRKPLAAVFVTHAHPDHFNGVFALTRDDDNLPVYATKAVAAAIREVAEPKRAQWGPVYGDAWPARTAHPTTEVDDGAVVDFTDLSITVRDLGPAESHADSYLLAHGPTGGAAFIGDLAFHGTHAYTADGHSQDWLAVLDLLSIELAEVPTLYPGHGAPTTASVFAEQRRYLVRLRELIARLADGEPVLSPAAKTELERLMTEFAPQAPLTMLIGLGADAIAEELNRSR